jgi:sialate O-acetylesterase
VVDQEKLDIKPDPERLIPAKTMRKNWFIIVLFAAATTSLWAQTKPFLHPLFTDNLVLQRDRLDKIWGWTTPGAQVTVVLNNQTNTATAGVDGRWQVTVGPFSVGGPVTLTVTGPPSVTLTNVVFGDVILCSGQSNMEKPVGVNVSQPNILNMQAEAASATNANIRQFLVPQLNTAHPQDTISGGNWVVGNPTNVLGFTAVGYFTAKYLAEATNVPIGILHSSVGGTAIQCWMDPQTIGQLADFSQSTFDLAGQVNTAYANSDVPLTELYNAMIAPLTNFSIRAVAWYQGESNVGQPQQYNKLLPALMRGWRAGFSQPHLPFIICQLANYGDGQTLPVEFSDSFEDVREAELNTVENDLDSRLVVQIDLGRSNSVSTAFVDIHQPDKEQVGQRAAWAALDLVYGRSLISQGPVLSATQVQGTNILCTFTNVGAGLTAGWFVQLSPVARTNSALTGFAMAGADGNYFSATATISADNQITVSSASVPAPLSVRYGWGFNPPCNLYGMITNASGAVVDGLPASPFRNDPGYILSVDNGTASNFNLQPNAVTSISSTAPTGETFAYWSGDTAQLSATNTAAATVMMTKPYVAVLANFAITSAPTGVLISGRNGHVSLSWNPLFGAHYNVKRATTFAGPFTVVGSNVNATNYVDVNASNNVTWFYKIAATNLVGEGPDAASVSVTPLGPGLSDLNAMAGDGLVTLTWQVTAGETAGDIQVGRSLVSGGPYTTIASVLTASYVDMAVTNGGTYYYVVTGTNSAGQSVISTEASASPQEAVPIIGNFGFESPQTTFDAFQPTGAAWTFIPVSGVTLNGSDYAGGNPPVPEGSQVAFLEANATISQTLSPFIPGAIYKITFAAAQQGNVAGPPQTWSVQMDGRVLGTFSPPATATNYVDYAVFFKATAVSHRLAFVGNTFTISTVLIDDVRIKVLPAENLSALRGNPLQLTWPLDYAGWKLQAQTNALPAGMGTNWVDVPNSVLTNQVSLPISLTNGCVFFRLVSPRGD